MFVRLVLSVFLAAVVGACATSRTPELRVLGVQDQPRHEVVFVQVTNPASRPMRLTKLEYTFAAANTNIIVSEGELELAREVPAGEAVVVEVPLDAAPDQPLTLRGKLTAELDRIVRTFKVSTKLGLK
jgi:hypothetical protein